MKHLPLMLILLLITSCSIRNKTKEKTEDYYRYVNTLIGTGDNGHTFPGACSPFGLIQASPESGNDGWKYCSGFNYADDSIIGFAQTHLNGTGGPDLGDVLILPTHSHKPGETLKRTLDKKSQYGCAGYYSVKLSDKNIKAEITATQRVAFYKFSFSNNVTPQILVDTQNGVIGWGKTVDDHVLESSINFIDSTTITGYNMVQSWVNRTYYYAIQFNKSYHISQNIPMPKSAKAKRMLLDFHTAEGEPIQVKIAISTVSEAGALQSIRKEIPHWDFEKTKEYTQKKWNSLFSKIQIEGTDEEKSNFYTSFYHLCIQPNDIADCDGRYRGANDSIYQSPTASYYSTFSLWDTYRAAHPFYTILFPKETGDMVQSMIQYYKEQNHLPIWALWGKETYCMIGNHAIPVIVDAYLKGIRGYDVNKAYEAIKNSSTQNHLNSDWTIYDKYGYYPFDVVPVESVSRTLESTYDDYCVSQMAKAMNQQDDYLYFQKRSNYWKNLFDPQTHLVRGRNSKGEWRTPFTPLLLSHATTSGGDYTEGNAWQYTWHIQQDIDGLIDLMGGKDAFSSKLDTLFFLHPTRHNDGFSADVTGLIGQYAHGNEPSHHISYLYNLADKPWKTQQLIREIVEKFYLANPYGLCGNDDCGQMSAWYIFSALGFYPVNPISGEYVIGAPQLSKATIHIPNGKTFTIKADYLDKTHKYIKSIHLNGKPFHRNSISHQEIMNGGTLHFEMTDTPCSYKNH